MNAEIHFVCTECGSLSDAQASGWRAEIVRGEDSDEELVFFCPECEPED